MNSSYTHESGNTHCICFNCKKHRTIDGECSCGAPSMRVKSKRNLMDELKEGIEDLAKRRESEREKLDENLRKMREFHKRERVELGETFAPRIDEEQYINRNDLLKDYARIIDEQKDIITRTLREIPVGYIPAHTAENLPELVKSWITDAVRANDHIEKIENQVK